MRMRAGVLALCLLLSAEAAYGADPSLEIIPPEVTARALPTATPIEADVRLKAGDAQLSNIAISTFSNDGISAELASDTPAQLKELAPKAEHAWRLKLTRGAGSVLA